MGTASFFTLLLLLYHTQAKDQAIKQYYTLIESHGQNQEYEKCIEDLEGAILLIEKQGVEQLSAGDLDHLGYFYSTRGNICYTLGRYDESINACNRALNYLHIYNTPANFPEEWKASFFYILSCFKLLPNESMTDSIKNLLLEQLKRVYCNEDYRQFRELLRSDGWSFSEEKMEYIQQCCYMYDWMIDYYEQILAGDEAEHADEQN